MPITMQTGLATQDTSYLRQNQLSGKGSSAKLAALPDNVPNNEQIQTMIASAMELQKQNVVLDRGSILNILA